MPPLRAGNVPLVRSIRLTPSGLWLCFLVAATTLLLAGRIRAQESTSAIDQSRLYPRTAPPTAGNLAPDTLSMPQGETVVSEDESFGAQQILKTEEKIPDFLITAGSSVYFTNNVALTRSGEQSEAFSVSEAAFSWSPRLSPQWQFQLGGALALFRYETSALDFESLGTGAGWIWTPPNFWGIAFLSRYDFVELLDRHSNQILQDHEFSIGAQKIVVLGRSHWLTFGLIGSAGISDPETEQRDQAGFGLGYHLQLSRQFAADLGYRHSWYFYNRGGRTDLNQVLSLGLHYNFRPWVALNGYLSGATNWSNKEVFKYDVFSGGGGLGLIIRF